MLNRMILMTVMVAGTMIARGQSSGDYASILSEYFDEDGPGATAIVAKGDKVLFKGAVGMADLELGVPMEVDHIFRLGSITKQFTAIAIMMLVEEGKVSVDDPLTKFLPEYPTQGHEITVEHLLTHTSGIQSYTNIPGWMFTETRTARTLEELIDEFKDYPMEFAPGQQWNYNNSGYILLGAIIEEASGMTYEEFVREHIFEKLGMNDSYYDDHNRIIPKRIPGYQPGPNAIENANFLDMSLPYAAGSLLSNVEDLHTWNTALHDHELVSEATIEQVFTPYTLSDGSSTEYGYGWSINKLRGDTTYLHGGGIFGFLTQGIYVPRHDVYVAVLSNCNCNEPDMPAARMAAMAIGKPFDFEPIELSPDSLQAYVGVYDIEDSPDARVITVKGGTLYSKRGSGSKFEVIPFAEDKFYYPGSLTTLEFNRDDEGRIVGQTVTPISGDGGYAVLTDEPIPERPSLTLSADILERYVGRYELGPGFILEVTHDEINQQLVAQATGQGPIPLSAETETHFYVEAVGAEIDFILNDDGKCIRLELNQGGQLMEAERIAD